MSLGDIIKFCPECKENILTTKQIEEGKLCWNCQTKHAEEFNKKYGIDNVDEKQNR